MATKRNPGKKPNRGSDMDIALFEALASAVPNKDTGPDPEHILEALSDDDAQGEESVFPRRGAAVRKIGLVLDDRETERAQQIVAHIHDQCGEQIELAQAVKIALYACEINDKAIYKAYREMTTRRGAQK